MLSACTYGAHRMLDVVGFHRALVLQSQYKFWRARIAAIAPLLCEFHSDLMNARRAVRIEHRHQSAQSESQPNVFAQSLACVPAS